MILTNVIKIIRCVIRNLKNNSSTLCTIIGYASVVDITRAICSSDCLYPEWMSGGAYVNHIPLTANKSKSWIS